jgi:hypothetical protein
MSECTIIITIRERERERAVTANPIIHRLEPMPHRNSVLSANKKIYLQYKWIDPRNTLTVYHLL